MGKYQIFTFLLLVLILSFIACSERSGRFVDPRHYPFEMPSEWEYNTTYVIENYDSSGNLSEPDTIITENTIVQIVSDNDSLGIYKNLYRLKSTDLSNPQFSENVWYLDADSGLYIVAYSFAGSSQPVLPKEKYNSELEVIRNVLCKLETKYFSLKITSANEDSIIYENPRKILKYPIYVGSNWQEMKTPFLIERTVKETRQIVLNIGIFNCMRINRTSNEPFWKHVTYDDYIDLNIGLILREMVVDSLPRTIEPGDTIGYFKVNSISKLIRKE